MDLDSINGLDANEWKTRLEAIENFYDLVRTNPEGVAKSISKVGNEASRTLMIPYITSNVDFIVLMFFVHNMTWLSTSLASYKWHFLYDALYRGYLHNII